MVTNLTHKLSLARRRQTRVRSRIVGSAQRPRLSVHISNLHVTAQLIDDTSGQTLVYASTVGRKLSGNLTEKAVWIGGEIAKKALKANIKTVKLDRGSKKYHGRLSALATSARQAGLEF